MSVLLIEQELDMLEARLTTIWTDEELDCLMDAARQYTGDWIRIASYVGCSKTPS